MWWPSFLGLHARTQQGAKYMPLMVHGGCTLCASARRVDSGAQAHAAGEGRSAPPGIEEEGLRFPYPGPIRS